ncbi:right-handed parallel beta-helix repeat-containing protein, partial [uncultured Phenylobacterium sp.]|uniref:right-handed parallel beta-helix repeat-containing protein n=1 Tax=uncultured Phenylobacterium sp. TaxID=349273 RepID=UPI0025E3E408
MSTITVSSSAALNVALKVAKAGDSILLNPGTYTGVGLNGLQVNGTVTVRSADLDHPAVLTGIGIRNSSGFSFEHVEINAVPGLSEKTGVIGIDGSKNISFDHVYVHGTLNGDASDDLPGIRIKLSSDITVTNSEFRQLFQAVSFGGNNNVTISGNLVHEIRQDGFRGYDTSNLTISDNYLTNFQKVGTEHADGIQIYTGSYGPAHDIRIIGNVIIQGDGAEVQGVFIRDDSSSLKNVEISGNLVAGATLNGIAVSGINGLVMDSNSVVSRTGELSWLSVKTSTDAIVTNNDALRFILSGDMVQANNELNLTNGSEGAVLQDWL